MGTDNRADNRRHGLRHGRGIAGELFAGDVPARLTRAQAFEALVARIFADIRERGGGELDHVRLAVDLLPPESAREPGPGVRPAIAAVFRADAQRPDTIVAYRGPLLRTPEDEAAALLEVELATRAAQLCSRSADDLLG